VTGDEPLCSECRAAKASIEISLFGGGRAEERRLMCAECASRLERLTFGRGPAVSLVQLVSQVADRHAERSGADARAGCPICGTALAEIISSGQPGCATCYSRFAYELSDLISKVQGASFHRGKAPVS